MAKRQFVDYILIFLAKALVFHPEPEYFSAALEMGHDLLKYSEQCKKKTFLIFYSFLDNEKYTNSFTSCL